jgi:hypothetical protein
MNKICFGSYRKRSRMARIKNKMDSSRRAHSIHFIFFVPGIGAVCFIRRSGGDGGRAGDSRRTDRGNRRKEIFGASGGGAIAEGGAEKWCGRGSFPNISEKEKLPLMFDVRGYAKFLN